MRYLWGHGRALSCEVAGSDGGIEEGVGSAEEVSSGDFGGGNAEALWERNGMLFVGPRLTKPVMSSGMFAGVTLSMNCHDGSSSTMEL
jgi:hypothetical protein